ncbi:threonylcarbamoyl-AMP synthase, partial [bacterium]|nr:threonylcarbamoyl-AMP synthase [bacterium]
ISLVLPNQDLPETEADVIDDKIGKQLDLIIDGEAGGMDFTTILDLTEDEPVILREGLGLADLALN